MYGSHPPAEGVCRLGIALLQDPFCKKHQIHLHSHKSKGRQSMISYLSAISKFMLLLAVKRKGKGNMGMNLKRDKIILCSGFSPSLNMKPKIIKK